MDAGVETDTLWVLQRGARVWGFDTFTADSGGEKISDESKIPTATVLQLGKDTGAVLKCAVFGAQGFRRAPSWQSGRPAEPATLPPAARCGGLHHSCAQSAPTNRADEQSWVAPGQVQVCHTQAQVTGQSVVSSPFAVPGWSRVTRPLDQHCRMVCQVAGHLPVALCTGPGVPTRW